MGLDGETSAPGGTAAMAVATSSGRAMLGRLGWTCAAVPYFEWDPLLASGATEPYLRGVLARLKSE